MQPGMIGLGRIGASMVLRLIKTGHECVVCDSQVAAVSDLEKDGAIGAVSRRNRLREPGAVGNAPPIRKLAK